MGKFILLATFQLFLSAAFGQTFHVGDKVEIYNSGSWYKGSILDIGTGSLQGYYSVKYDGYNQPQWMKASNIRLQKAESANAVNSSSGPRNGSYIILSYGNPNNPIRIGYFELNSGKYSYYGMDKKLLGQGSYVYDAKNKLVQWTNGPFKNFQWGGGFEIDREGKTHKIRLTSVTIGSNSTDSN